MIDPRRGGRRGMPRGSADRMLAVVVGRLGVPFAGVWMLDVRGRRTGRVRRIPVIPRGAGGTRHLVAPRGTTGWVRDLRAEPRGALRRGRRTWAFRAEELRGEDRIPVLADYVAATRRFTARFFDVPHPATEADIRRIADRHPVFRLTPAD